VLGYQYRDVYYYAQVGYDQTYASSSPGTGLLYLLIKDLIENTSAKRLSFDYGDAGYKREFGNVHAEDATVLLMRKTFSNRLRRHFHGAFGSVVKHLKTWFMRRSASL
jgi:CelD/BcsL family acetyltransferase involved in cellulose biosynthesis